MTTRNRIAHVTVLLCVFALAQWTGNVHAALVTPIDTTADMSRTGPGNPPLIVNGSVGWTIFPDIFPGGDVDLGEDPVDSFTSIASWYVKDVNAPVSLYYDLGQAMTVDKVHTWWQTQFSQTTSIGLVTDLDIDYIALGDVQPGSFDLATMQAVTNWTNVVSGYAPTLGVVIEQTQDVPDFTTRYFRLKMNDALLAPGQWGGLQQVAM